MFNVLKIVDDASDCLCYDSHRGGYEATVSALRRILGHVVASNAEGLVSEKCGTGIFA